MLLFAILLSVLCRCEVGQYGGPPLKSGTLSSDILKQSLVVDYWLTRSFRGYNIDFKCFGGGFVYLILQTTILAWKVAAKKN